MGSRRCRGCSKSRCAGAWAGGGSARQRGRELWAASVAGADVGEDGVEDENRKEMEGKMVISAPRSCCNLPCSSFWDFENPKI